ncbi:glycosyltransferase [Leptolyngbya sp. FACHB-36]|uniref:glycosyltransferase n=1 Tax=Leptolyngbya sp. FACHB-36 TaxID=2692808 RepID=UPI00168185CF|nr:glycosyltransferase [Leptolyngbya sp. FACHB-36]MBD2022749.1 glycosyltransferase [Leptolyngbya sp. FACHB-36]
MNLLFLTTTLPRKKRTGSEQLSQCFIDALEHSGHSVWVLGYQRKAKRFPETDREVTIDERHIETSNAGLYPLLWMARGVLSNLPYSSAKYVSKAYGQAVQQALQARSYDAVIIDHAQLGWLARFIPPALPVVLLTHNVEHELYTAQLSDRNAVAKWVYGREAALIERVQTEVVNRVREVWTLTAYDTAYFSGIKPIGVRGFKIPYSMQAAPLTCEKTYDIGILGSWTWKANLAGLRWFVEAVYPLLPKHVSIRVAGAGADWLANQYPNLEYCGFVPDPRVFLSEAKAVAIPSVSGSGIQIKTLEAIALGAPIVATCVALRGITDYPESIQLADAPADFAAALLERIATPMASTLQTDAIAWSEQRYDQFVAEVNTAIESLTGRCLVG